MGTLIALLLIVALFVILGAGVWIGIAVLGVAWLGDGALHHAPRRATALALTVWGSMSSWTLTALPLFVWMGEILLKTRLSEGMFRGLAPWLQWLPGRLLHTNIIGCTIFAAVSGSSAATCATIGKITLPELDEARLPGADLDRFARRRRHARAADSAVDHHDRLRRGGGRLDRQALHRRRASRA